jgi:hypothetical protein
VKTLAVLSLVFGLVAILIVTGCNDRTRDNCITNPSAPRCDTGTGATTP